MQIQLSSEQLAALVRRAIECESLGGEPASAQLLEAIDIITKSLMEVGEQELIAELLADSGSNSYKM